MDFQQQKYPQLALLLTLQRQQLLKLQLKQLQIQLRQSQALQHQQLYNI